MDRRTFLKTVTQAAAVAAAGGMSSRTEASMPRRMTVAAVGDCIPARRMSERKDRAFLDVVDLLRSADCTWGNCETVFAEARSVYPSPKGFDPHCLSQPWGADEMAFVGIDFVGTANNHALDWGYQGLFSTLEQLERVGLAHAGAGADLAAASRPGYYDSAAGRVAQVNCTSTFPPYFAAAPAHPYLNGRPGLNVLTPQYLVQVDQELFDQLRPLQEELIQLRGWGVFADLLAKLLTEQLPEGTAFIEEVLFKGGDGTDLLSQARESDVERITQALAIGRHNARVVLATMHCHEARNELEVPDLFIEPFAHAAMDAGADLFFAAGPHVLRGIEIYDGKPIFYGLANFIFHYETLGKIPAESWMSVGLEADSLDPSAFAATIPYPNEARFWQSVIPLVTLEGGAGPGGAIESPTVVSIELYPIVQGFGEPIYRRGTPEMAPRQEATEILQRVARLSEPYGTTLTIRDGVGYVELG